MDSFHATGLKLYYNIPRAWLLNRSPVPAMVLESNGLFHFLSVQGVDVRNSINFCPGFL